MAVTQNAVVTPQKPNRGAAQLTSSSSTTTPTTLYTGGANGTKIVAIIAQSTDTAAHDIQVSIVNGGTTYTLGTVTVPIGAGNSGTVPSVNLLNSSQLPGLPVDSDGNPFIYLAGAGDVLSVLPKTALSASTFVNITAVAEDF